MTARTLSLVVLAGVLACSNGSPGGGDDGGGGGFELRYRAGGELLIDLQVDASLSFSGEAPAVPSLDDARVAQTLATVMGNGQQVIDLAMSNTDDLDIGDRFVVRLEFSRANDGAVIDAGGTLNMACSFAWYTADDELVSLTGDCDVHRDKGGYHVDVANVFLDDTQLSGTLDFSPVPNEPFAYTPDGFCSDDQTCLSLDLEDFEPETGYCLPRTNLKSQALPCSPDCAAQLDISVGGAQTCLCTAVCGRLESTGGGDPPVCDPAYGCIDF
jgi:hypothetical protein